jgi:hypothetical protein
MPFQESTSLAKIAEEHSSISVLNPSPANIPNQVFQ